MQSYPAPIFGASGSQIALLAQAARLRKHLGEATALYEELALDLSRSMEENVKLPRNSPVLKEIRQRQNRQRKQLKISRLDIKRTEILIELIARSV